MSNRLEKIGRVLEIRGREVIGEGREIVEVVVESGIKVGGSIMMSPVLYTFMNRVIDKLDGIKVGDIVVVRFDVVGKEWRRRDGVVKYINNLVVSDVMLLDMVDEYVEVEI